MDLSFSYQCDACLQKRAMKRKENKFTAKSKFFVVNSDIVVNWKLFVVNCNSSFFPDVELPSTKLGDLIEKRVNGFLIKENYPGNVTIRIVSACDKQVDVKPGMKSRFVAWGKK